MRAPRRSFIGFSQAFPKLIVDSFGFKPYGSTTVNPKAPVATDFAWLGALVGSIIRPVGGILADRYGGARVTQWNFAAMFALTIAGGVIIQQTRSLANPEENWGAFLAVFLREPRPLTPPPHGSRVS